MKNEDLIEIAKKHGATHKASLGVYQFWEHEMLSFVREAVSEFLKKEAERLDEILYHDDADYIRTLAGWAGDDE